MSSERDGRLLIVPDGQFLLNLLRIGRIDLLARHCVYKGVVTEHALDEVSRQRLDSRLRDAINSGFLEMAALTDAIELASFGTYARYLSRSEAAAIVVAQRRKIDLASDATDWMAKTIEQALGKHRRLTTVEIILQAVRHGGLTVTDADTIKDELESIGLCLSFSSFGTLL